MTVYINLNTKYLGCIDYIGWIICIAYIVTIDNMQKSLLISSVRVNVHVCVTLRVCKVSEVEGC